MEVGLDRLSLSFRLAAPPDDDAWQSGTRTESLAAAARVGVSYLQAVPIADGNTVAVGAIETPDGWYGKVEGNPSRFPDPKGCTLRPLADVGEAVDELLEVAHEHLAIETHPKFCKVGRVDLAVDFRDLRSPGLYTRGLAPLKRQYARFTQVWHDPELGGAETLVVGSKVGQARLYDQHAAYADRGAPLGSLRWEVQARAGWCDRLGFGVVSGLNPTALQEAARQKWEWSRMGTKVTATVGVIELIDQRTCRHSRPRGACVLDCGALSPARADRLLAMLVRQAHGSSAATCKATSAAYDQLMRDLGSTPAHGLGSVVPLPEYEFSGSLDPTTGSELAA